MCFTCSKLLICDQKGVEKTKKDFTECSKYMIASLPIIKIDPYFNIEKARQLENEAEKDYVKFIKAHYLATDDKSYRPYAVSSIDKFQAADRADDSENEAEMVNQVTRMPFFLIRLAFVAHYQLRLTTKQLVDVLERSAEKKRKRRLQYKANKRERQTSNM